MERSLMDADPCRGLLRAALCVLAVLAQLLLPAALDRAQAAVARTCYGAASSADQNRGGDHALDQHCASCLPQFAAALPAPQGATLAVERHFTSVHAPAFDGHAAPFARDERPPSTGPPASLASFEI